MIQLTSCKIADDIYFYTYCEKMIYKKICDYLRRLVLFSSEIIVEIIMAILWKYKRKIENN